LADNDDGAPPTLGIEDRVGGRLGRRPIGRHKAAAQHKGLAQIEHLSDALPQMQVGIHMSRNTNLIARLSGVNGSLKGAVVALRGTHSVDRAGAGSDRRGPAGIGQNRGEENEQASPDCRQYKAQSPCE